MKPLPGFTICFFLALIINSSCKKTDLAITPPPPSANNHSPVANAGTDQTIILPKDSVELRGSGTGKITAYQWTKISGPASVIIVTPTLANTIVKGLVQGVYAFELKVNDSTGKYTNDTVQITVNANAPPVANAGPDQSFKLTCTEKAAVTKLDATASYDLDNNITTYKWAVIYGPAMYSSRWDSASAKTEIILWPGQYAFELTVTDAGGLSSKDTVLINVEANSGTTEFLLDISVTTAYTFLDNYINPWEGDTYYYDETYLIGNGVSISLGKWQVGIYEIADTPTLSDKLFYNSFQIIKGISDDGTFREYISGDVLGINFKKLIREGGGLFAGTFIATGGSAEYCDSTIFSKMLPLTITGNLNVATHAISLNIKGKVYF